MCERGTKEVNKRETQLGKEKGTKENTGKGKEKKGERDKKGRKKMRGRILLHSPPIKNFVSKFR